MKGSTVLLFAVLLLVASATQLNDIFVKVRPLREKQLNEKFLSTLTRAERRQAVYDELTSIAKISQAGLISDLKKTSVEFRSFWISNSIYIQGVSDSFVSLLKSRPDVIEVHKEHFAKLIESVDVVESKERLEAPGWNLEAINVPSAWNVTSGEGIVVANIDTGVRYTHEALVGNYRGANDNGTFSHDYNWFDLKGSTSPSDGNGHGTHTMGSIVGSKDSGVGVAPGSKWIAAQGCRTILCSEADLTGSAEFVLCPTKLDGTEPDCSQGADVVSNSWGGGQGDDWYTSYVEAWRDAGIIPVFAQGNSGPQCETANSPGDLASVIGVGATDNGNALARFSSRGPSVNGNLPFTEIKPDISAPGAAVRSCSNRGDSTYASMSGTSMACPHIAGVVALILSANPSATYDQVYEALTSTASHDIDAPNGGAENCGGLNYDEFPNNHYGHGLADALAAVEAI